MTGKIIGTNLFLLTLLAGLETGCTSVQTQKVDPATGVTNTVTTKVPDVALMSGIARSATYLGTRVYLNGVAGSKTLTPHPEARDQFEMARTSLRALIAAGTFSPADLTAAMQSLPVKEFKGEEGTLIVDTAVSLWDSYGQLLTSLDRAQYFSLYVLPVAKAILAGLDAALGPAPGATLNQPDERRARSDAPYQPVPIEEWTRAAGVVEPSERRARSDAPYPPA